MAIPDLANSAYRVALIARNSRHRQCLAQILADNELHVVDEAVLDNHLPKPVDSSIADVLLINLEEGEEDALEEVIDQAKVPVLFNEAAAIRNPETISGRAWGRRLASKLGELAKSEPEEPQIRADETPSSRPELRVVDQAEEEAATSATDDLDLDQTLETLANAMDLDDAEDFEEVDQLAEDLSLDLDLELDEVISQANESEAHTDQTLDINAAEELDFDLQDLMSDETVDLDPDTEEFDFGTIEEDAVNALVNTAEIRMAPVPPPSGEPAEQVWILGASIGGPQAVKEFLAALPEGLPSAFILAQHIGAGFVDLLAEQLGRIAPLKVVPGQEGMMLQHGQLIVAPVEQQIIMNDNCEMKLEKVLKRTIYSPSIDDVMIEMARYFGANCHAIVFSGMGNDGLKGCKAIANAGGTIWAQDASSCVISSMADAARSTGAVSLSAAPAELAERLGEWFKQREEQ